MGRLKQQPLPVVNLHKENQQSPWGERRAEQLKVLLKGIRANNNRHGREGVGAGLAALRQRKVRNEAEAASPGQEADGHIGVGPSPH